MVEERSHQIRSDSRLDYRLDQIADLLTCTRHAGDGKVV